RPLWDIVVWTLLIGSTVLSSTTLVPMFRRLKRHAGRLKKALGGRRAPRPQTVPSEAAMSSVVIARNSRPKLVHRRSTTLRLNFEWRSRHAVHCAIRRQTGSGGTAPEIDAATLGLPG